MLLVAFFWQKGQETLSPGMKGVLISCNERENRCVAEAYNVLNEVKIRGEPVVLPMCLGSFRQCLKASYIRFG